MITLLAILIAGKYGMSFTLLYLGTFFLDLALFSTISDFANKGK